MLTTAAFSIHFVPLLYITIYVANDGWASWVSKAALLWAVLRKLQLAIGKQWCKNVTERFLAVFNLFLSIDLFIQGLAKPPSHAAQGLSARIREYS